MQARSGSRRRRDAGKAVVAGAALRTTVVQILLLWPRPQDARDGSLHVFTCKSLDFAIQTLDMTSSPATQQPPSVPLC